MIETFAELSEHVKQHFNVVHEEKFVLGLEVDTGDDTRRQSLFLAELRDSDDHRVLRVETTVAPLAQHDPVKALRVNLLLRVGYLAVGDLEGIPFLKLCENVAYRSLTPVVINDRIVRVARLGDEIEQTLTGDGSDYF
ncbi:MAG: hypothetical protein AAGH65_07935 [Pseudomonadota bacterium]